MSTVEQRMIESLSQHGIEANDLSPSLMTTHTVANPEYDPSEAHRQAAETAARELEEANINSEDLSAMHSVSSTPHSATLPASTQPSRSYQPPQTTARILQDTATSSLPGVSTQLSTMDKNVTLDIRWTVLCDLFLIIVADSVYDARSRVLLENVALKLGLGWLDMVKFERRITEALDIQEEIESLDSKENVEDVKKNSKRRRYMMLGLATLGT